MKSKTGFSFHFFNLKARFAEGRGKGTIVVPVIAIVLAVLLSVISCNPGQPADEEQQTEHGAETIKTKLEPNCWGINDTIFSNNNFLKYVPVGDSVVDLRVRIGDREAMLGFRFTCNVPGGLVPKIFEHRRGQIVLIRGYGQHFREVLVCSQTDGKILLKRFESEVAIGAKYGAAYFNSNDPTGIVVIDLLTRKAKNLPLPSLYLNSVKRFEIGGDSIVIVDAYEHRLAISL